jgi:hypothetical protein
MLAVAGAGLFVPLLRRAVLAVAGDALLALILLPTMLAVAGAALFAKALSPFRRPCSQKYFVPCILQHLVRRPQQHLVFPFTWISLSALNMAAGVSICLN